MSDLLFKLNSQTCITNHYSENRPNWRDTMRSIVDQDQKTMKPKLWKDRYESLIYCVAQAEYSGRVSLSFCWKVNFSINKCWEKWNSRATWNKVGWIGYLRNWIKNKPIFPKNSIAKECRSMENIQNKNKNWWASMMWIAKKEHSLGVCLRPSIKNVGSNSKKHIIVGRIDQI